MQIKHLNDTHDGKAGSRLAYASFALIFGGLIFSITFSALYGDKVGPIVWLLCLAIAPLAMGAGFYFLKRASRFWDASHNAYRDQYLSTLSKEQLIAVSVSQEFTAEERGMATAMLNNRHPGWSVNASDPVSAGE